MIEVDENGRALKCVKCGHPSQEGDYYCEECGTPLVNYCTNSRCGHVNRPTTKACVKCGSHTAFAPDPGPDTVKAIW